MHVRTDLLQAPPTSYTATVEMNPLVFVLVVYVAVCSADWQDGNDGTDRLNGDLPNMPLQMKAGSSPQDCAHACYASSQCKAWVFGRTNCGGTTSRLPQCFLKAEVTQQSVRPCRVSRSDAETVYTLISLSLRIPFQL